MKIAKPFRLIGDAIEKSQIINNGWYDMLMTRDFLRELRDRPRHTAIDPLVLIFKISYFKLFLVTDLFGYGEWTCRTPTWEQFMIVVEFLLRLIKPPKYSTKKFSAPPPFPSSSLLPLSVASSVSSIHSASPPLSHIKKFWIIGRS